MDKNKRNAIIMSAAFCLVVAGIIGGKIYLDTRPAVVPDDSIVEEQEANTPKEELILPDLEEKANALAEKAEKEEAGTPSEPSVETTTPPVANTADPDPLLPDSNKKPDKNVTKHEAPEEEEEDTPKAPPVKTPTKDEAAQHPGKVWDPAFGWMDSPRTDGGGETPDTPAEKPEGWDDNAQYGTM